MPQAANASQAESAGNQSHGRELRFEALASWRGRGFRSAARHETRYLDTRQKHRFSLLAGLSMEFTQVCWQD